MNNPIFPIALRNGITFALILIIISLLFFFVDLQYESWTGFISYGLIFIFSITALFYYSKTVDSLSFGMGFKVGALSILIMSVLYAIYMLFYLSVINPDFFEVFKGNTYDKLIEKGLSAESAKNMIEKTSFFMTPTMTFISTLFQYSICGVIFSAIGAAIFKKH